MHNKILNFILVKPAGPDCNLACDYCFYLDKVIPHKPGESAQSSHRMSLPLLEAMTRQAMAAPGTQISFTWQGGEPTLMGLDFFRQAIRLQQQYGKGKQVENSLQTNGLLIDQEWATFLREQEVLVGLSLDGPQHIHDRYRRRRNGTNSWNTTLETATMLLEQGVSVNALIVVNDYSVQYAEEIYRFHKALGLTWMQFLPCVEPESSDPGKASVTSVSGLDYGHFLMALFDLWWDDLDGVTPATQIRFFDAALHSYLDLPSSLCVHRPTCGDYLVVEHNGDVYPCDFFVEPEWRLGNLLEKDLPTLLSSRKQERFGQSKSSLPEKCQSCEWLRQCWGGCLKDRRIRAERNQTWLCDGYKLFFEHAHQRLTELARRLRMSETTGG